MAAQQQRRPQSTSASSSRNRTTSQPRRSVSSQVRPFHMPFESKNIIIIIAGVALITVGYFLMGSDEVMGSMALNVSPLILLLGYLVVIPFGIMYGAKRSKSEEKAEDKAGAIEAVKL